ncbi:hypothetical protein [Stieleria mannarensis]|uniref:hypothetical protein n=1 Tax=Stieleria mannarensis TaxID=2755585 RepID=UPI0016026117|nr:hypothetical protein [Rhodopirellula sp. JC639]
MNPYTPPAETNDSFAEPPPRKITDWEWTMLIAEAVVIGLWILNAIAMYFLPN